MNVQGGYEFNLTPCLPTESCFEPDYDPCEFGFDITDEDLAILLRNEKPKTERDDELGAEYDSTSEEQNEKTGKKRRGARMMVTGPEEMIQDEEEEQTLKKRVCKKPIKNPFFTNRLDLSSKLPLPPPSPPQQFLPPVEEKDSKGRIICPKRRRKCRKKTDDRKTGKAEKNQDEGERGERGSDFDTKHGRDDQDGRENLEGQRKQSQIGISGSQEEIERGSEDSLSVGNKKRKGEEGVRSGEDGKGKRRCKRKERPPCRKKISDISLIPQPRRIPALQRDLPPTCPKDIPEVERQILLGCKNVCQASCRKRKCKKKK